MHLWLKSLTSFIGPIVLSQPCSGCPSSQVRHFPRIFKYHVASKGDKSSLVKDNRTDSDETLKLFIAKIDHLHSSLHWVRPIPEVNPTFLLSKPRSLLLSLSLRHPISEMFPLVPCRLLLGNVQSSQMVSIHSFSIRLQRVSRFPFFCFSPHLIDRSNSSSNGCWCSIGKKRTLSASSYVIIAERRRDQLTKSIADWKCRKVAVNAIEEREIILENEKDCTDDV